MSSTTEIRVTGSATRTVLVAGFNPTSIDEYAPTDTGDWSATLTHPDTNDGLRVIAQHTPQGQWAFGVAPLTETTPLPDWAFEVRNTTDVEPPLGITVRVPAGVRLTKDPHPGPE